MKNYLITIGIDEYKTDRLANCVKDVIDFRDILFDKYQFDPEDHIELLNANATNKKIQDCLQELASKIDSKDSLLIFFSGHGSYDERSGMGYWIPVDASDDYTTWLPNDRILTLLKNIDCKHLFLIADSCFSHSLLLTNNPKSNFEYGDRASRWALVSAYDESYTSPDPNINSEFARSLIEFLEETEEEIRVSSLIEYVKQSFNGNEIQAPQGYPLNIRGHRGGEFIFRISQPLDKRDLKGFSNFLKVLKLYKKNVQFKELLKFEDKSNKFGYQIYQEYDQVIKRSINYLYLYSGSSLTKTISSIREKRPDIINNSKQNLIVFLQQEPNQIDPSKRLANVNKAFRPVNAFYIDNFIRESCTPSFADYDLSGSFLQISNFILPSFNGHGSQIKDINLFLESWHKKEREPILIIKGTAGIGKTTFAQFVSDNLRQKSQNLMILFIDSVLLKENLQKQLSSGSQLTVYNFYEALHSYDGGKVDKLSEDQFNLNLDAGNFLVIIDGLDEVISKIPGFDVDLFLRSIQGITNELGIGKVIITCRTHFWNRSLLEVDFEEIELNPFTKSQAQEFFEKSLNSTKKKQRALKLAEEFKFSNQGDENAYHPYVLDIIRSILELESDEISLDLTSFNSEILNPEEKNDYILFRVCDREVKRIGQIKVDDQIKFFKYLANEKRGIIKARNFDRDIKAAFSKNIDEVNVEAFKSHPFLVQHQSNITFRYDFFAEIFRAIEIAQYFNFKNHFEEVPLNVIEILSENCWFDSGLNLEVVKRIRSWNEEDLLFVSDLIDKFIKSDKLTETSRRQAAANVFNISLRINHKYHQNSVEFNTALLRSLFGIGNEIRNLRIVNLESDKTIRFNFSGLNVKRAYFDSYGSFYECIFDAKTIFSDSVFLNVESTKSGKIDRSIFVNCSYDKHVENAIQKYEDKLRSSADKALDFLNAFFHLFYSNGHLGRQWEDKVIKVRFSGIDKYHYGYKKIMRILIRESILQRAEEKEGVKLFINEEYKNDVIKFVKDGTVSRSITKIVKELN